MVRRPHRVGPGGGDDAAHRRRARRPDRRSLRDAGSGRLGRCAGRGGRGGRRQHRTRPPRCRGRNAGRVGVRTGRTPRALGAVARADRRPRRPDGPLPGLPRPLVSHSRPAVPAPRDGAGARRRRSLAGGPPVRRRPSPVRPAGGMNILIWHVHGSWTTAFVQGPHTYLVPVTPDRDADGGGRARTWTWPPNVIERTPRQLPTDEIDLVVLQRERDEPLFREWTGRAAGRDVPAVWLQHNMPQGRISDMQHPAADRRDGTVVHGTHTKQLFWNCGTTRSVVIEPGVIDPGHLFTGDIARAAVVVNEPVRRDRVVGTDLLQRLASAVPLDLFGMETAPLACATIAVHDVPTQ